MVLLFGFILDLFGRFCVFNGKKGQFAPRNSIMYPARATKIPPDKTLNKTLGEE